MSDSQDGDMSVMGQQPTGIVLLYYLVTLQIQGPVLCGGLPATWCYHLFLAMHLG